MKKVLLLGDSIRLNYMPAVFRQMSDRAVIYGPEENCRFSKYTLWGLDGWLGGETYDVIHFNCGIWDATRTEGWDNDTFSTEEEYERCMEMVIRRLLRTGSKLIIATSTPSSGKDPCHRNSDIIRFNGILCKLAERYSIPVNDLWSLVASDPERYICEDGLHLSREGIKAAAQAVTDAVDRRLSE